MNKPQSMAQSTDTTHPTLIVIRGLPGSGKSYLAAELKKSIGNDTVVSLDPDKTDYDSKEYIDHTNMLTAEGIDVKLHPYRFLRSKAYRAIAAHSVIVWNQPFTNLEMFNKITTNLQAHAEEHDTYLPILVVEVEVDHAVAKERLAKRKQAGGHGPSDSTFTRFVGDYGSFAPHGYRTITVDGSGDVAVSVAAIVRALRQDTSIDL